MANKKIKKITVDKSIFLKVLEQKSCSIRKLGAEYETIQRTERQIRRYLEDGEMPAEVLDNIARYLNVEPVFLSGALHARANSYPDELIKELAISNLSVEKHPYPFESSTMIRYPEIFEGIINLYNISMLDFNLLSPEKRVLFRQELDLAILKVIGRYFEHNSKGEDLIDEISFCESIVDEIDPFSYYANLEGIGFNENELS